MRELTIRVSVNKARRYVVRSGDVSVEQGSLDQAIRVLLARLRAAKDETLLELVTRRAGKE